MATADLMLGEWLPDLELVFKVVWNAQGLICPDLFPTSGLEQAWALLRIKLVMSTGSVWQCEHGGHFSRCTDGAKDTEEGFTRGEQ